MPRSNRPRRSKRSEESSELNLDLTRLGFKRTEVKRGVLYSVQTSTGANAEAGKSWVCPHCNISINIGQSHIVAWDEVRGVETRRHFHSGCWSKFQGPLL